MQIQINTDKNISGDEEVSQNVEDTLRRVLGRFSDRITRIEVHLSDENSASKSGITDKRCLLEVRLAGQQPIVVNDQAQSIEKAVTGAGQQMVNLLETELGKRGKH